MKSSLPFNSKSLQIGRNLEFIRSAPFLFSQVPGLAKDVVFHDFSDFPLAEMEEIPAHLDPEGQRRLGVYAEALLRALLTNDSRYTLLAENVQVFDGKRTIGEMDLIYQDLALNQVFHLEMALKFYLGVGNGSELSDWVGPNVKDRLDLKVGKLVDKQLQLSQTEAGKARLAEIGIGAVGHRLFLKGSLFYPLREGNFSSPEGLNPQHGRGWWATTEEVALDAPTEFRWQLFPRLRWLAPELLPDEVGLSWADLVDETARRFAEGRGPQMVRAFSVKTGEPVQRAGFLVPKDWETRAVAVSQSARSL